ncbi:MAG: NAD+ synthase [Gammaproteobacteria bacterium]|nr:NAD+ synthase [Gammaproteobacteria bacterium]
MQVPIHVALAQINLCVGDIAGNADRIITTAQRARDEFGANLVVFPELALTGYPPEDLLFRPGLHRRVATELHRITNTTTGVTIVLGYPEATAEGLYNTACVLQDRTLVSTYRKQRLPNYAVFDEKRYFTPGHSPTVVEIAGIKFSLSICEDIWDPETALAARVAGAEVILNLNASPYSLNKRHARLNALRAAQRASGLPILYCNLVGGQDELVFDGGSVALDQQGTVIASVADFEESLMVLTLTRESTGIHLQGPQALPTHDEETIYRALVIGIRDYVAKNRFQGAVLGLSGGIDSALTLALAVDALGADNVTAISMPSRYTAQMSIDDALTQARTSGCESHLVPIEAPFSAFNQVLAPIFAGRAADVTEENIQARCRGVILMAISNKTGRIVLTTGNKSEMAVGYATLYGDMAGGFAPLKDCPKTLVYRLAAWRNQQGSVIPERVIERPPSAELRPDQKDSDSLPPYEVLDPILELYIERDLTPHEISARGYDLATVKRVAAMVDRNEYKRRQAAPGVRISERAFGRDRRFPITSRYSEQEPTPGNLEDLG